MRPDKLSVVFLGGLDYALRGGTPRAEGCNERVVLAAQHSDFGVRLVQMVLE